MIERTALRLLPIMKELGNRLAGTSTNKGATAFHTNLIADSVDLKGSVTEMSNILESQKKSLEKNLAHKKSTNNKGLLMAADE
jgi:hypothetical protein